MSSLCTSPHGPLSSCTLYFPPSLPDSEGGTPLTKHWLVSKFRRLLATAGVTGHARVHRDYSHNRTFTSIRLLFIIFHFALDVCSHVIGVAFPSTQPGLFCMRVAEKLLFSSFSLPVFVYSKLLSVPKHKLRVLFVSGGPVGEFGSWVIHCVKRMIEFLPLKQTHAKFLEIKVR